MLGYLSRSAATALVALAAVFPPLSAAPLDVGDPITVDISSRGLSRYFDIDVPAGAASFLVQIVGEADCYYLVTDLVDPEGRVLVQSDPDAEGPGAENALCPLGPLNSPNRATPGPLPGAAALLVPNNPSVRVVPGTWRCRVGAYDPYGQARATQAAVSVVVKTGAIAGRARLPLHFYFTGSRHAVPGQGVVRLWSDTAQKSPAFAEALEKLQRIFGAVQIDLVPAGYHDLPAQTADACRSLESLEELRQLFSSPDNVDGVAILFVEEGVAGLSGGLPGFAATPGAVASGIACSTWTTTPARIGVALAHELGHFLGLFHTHELAIQAEDQLEDTRSGAAGSSNLMFPTLANMAVSLSEDQAWVIRHHPAVQAE